MASSSEVIKTVASWTGLIFVSVVSIPPSFLITGYIQSKSPGLQRLVDLIYSDIARFVLRYGS